MTSSLKKEIEGVSSYTRLLPEASVQGGYLSQAGKTERLHDTIVTMNMKTSNIRALLIATALCSIVSCQSEEWLNELYRPAGSEIFFGAPMGYQNGEEETRTEYSGRLYGFSPSRYERIDWKNDDKMTIVYNQSATAGTYVVTYVNSSDDKNSSANVESVSDADKLVWGSGSTHTFYAMYPENSSGRNSLSDNVVTGTIPASQNPVSQTGTRYFPDMDYAFMVAYAGSGQIVGNRVQLPFTPAMTAFQFKLQRASTDNGNLKLRKVQLISDDAANHPICGDFTFRITGGDSNGATWNKNVGTTTSDTQLSNKGNTITVDFGTSGVTLPEHGGTDYLEFTMLALPVSLTGLTVRLTYTNDTTKSIALKDNESTYHTFTACKKYIITNTTAPAEEWQYYFEDNLTNLGVAYNGATAQVLNNSFKSYRYKAGGTKEKVSYKFQYLNGSTWVDGLPSGLTKNSGDLTGSTTGTNLTLTVASQTNSATDPHATTLKNRTEVTGFDLTRDQITKGTLPSSTTYNYDYDEGKGHSANCYVITGPGTYKFPLVYGNAYDRGGADTPAYCRIKWNNSAGDYSYITSDGDSCLGYFHDHAGNDLTAIWIEKQVNASNLTASILWMDEPGLISSVSITGLGSTGKNTAWMTFTVPKDYICQGNAVLAVKSGSTILWSWHIWVTDQALNFGSTKYGTDGKQQFMPVPLGWCDGKYSQKYDKRSWTIRVIQENSGYTQQATVTQYSRKVFTVGYSPVYQWGRKDPMPPFVTTVTQTESASGTTTSHSTANMPLYPSGATGWSYNTSTSVPMHTTIQNPCVQYDGVSIYNNLWNTAHGTTETPGKAFKSIYDPCPWGYKIPTTAAYSGFTSSNLTYSTWSEITPPGLTYTNGLFFPCIGERRASDGTITNYATSSDPAGYIFSVDPASNACYIEKAQVVTNSGISYFHAFNVRPVIGERFNTI